MRSNLSQCKTCDCWVGAHETIFMTLGSCQSRLCHAARKKAKGQKFSWQVILSTFSVTFNKFKVLEHLKVRRIIPMNDSSASLVAFEFGHFGTATNSFAVRSSAERGSAAALTSVAWKVRLITDRDPRWRCTMATQYHWCTWCLKSMSPRSEMRARTSAWLELIYI